VKKRIAIIGGGIVGLAIAHKLLEEHPTAQVELFEKEKVLGAHQSGRNSGVLHCGLYYQPGSLKAQLAVDGIRQMTAFCEKHHIRHEICGKVVVSTSPQQSKTLEELAQRGQKNGLKGLKFLNNQELKVREPHVVAENSLLVPEEGIADYKAVMSKLAELIEAANGTVHLGSLIHNVEEKSNGEVIVHSENGSKAFDLLVSCTGLFSDRSFERFTKKKRPLRIVPFRGEYLMFKSEYQNMVNHLVYPVPDIKYPFLGVHFTRLINGDREVGPNAVLALKREGYTLRDFSLGDTADSLFYKGFGKFIIKNFAFAVGEFSSSILLSSFIKKAQIMIPDIDASMFQKGTAGVRAQAMSESGTLIMDFRIERVGNQIHVLNAPSPGATASLAIADYVIKQYLKIS
jgi:L-2-hydroxyglutarate oxidase